MHFLSQTGLSSGPQGRLPVAPGLTQFPSWSLWAMREADRPLPGQGQDRHQVTWSLPNPRPLMAQHQLHLGAGSFLVPQTPCGMPPAYSFLYYSSPPNLMCMFSAGN